MDTRKIGSQGFVVGAIGLGCMGMTHGYGTGDEAQSIATIHRALDCGVTLLDTAEMYGPHTNQELVGKAIRGWREKVVLATKFGLGGSKSTGRPPMQGALHQGRPEVALTFGHSDPSPTLKIEAIRELLWVGQFRDAFEFLEAMPDPDFLKATKHMNEEDLPPSIRSHMIACCRSLVSETVDSKARLRLLLRLAALGDQDISTSLKVELTVLPQQTVKAVSEYSIRPAIEIVIKVDREWVSRFVAERIIDGSLWPDTWLSFVSGMPESSRERLVERVSTEDLRGGANGGIISLLVAIADTTLAKTIFVKLRDHRQELAADPRNAEKQAIDAQLRGLFQFLSAPVAVEGLSDILAEKPDDAELSIITEMFSSMDLSTKG